MQLGAQFGNLACSQKVASGSEVLEVGDSVVRGGLGFLRLLSGALAVAYESVGMDTDAVQASPASGHGFKVLCAL